VIAAVLIAIVLCGTGFIGITNKVFGNSCSNQAFVKLFRDFWIYIQIAFCVLSTTIYLLVVVKLRSRRKPKPTATANNNSTTNDANADRNRKMTIMVMWMVAAFMTFTVTSNVLRQIYPFMTNTYLYTAVSQIVGILILLNTWIDLIIYAKRNDDIKVPS